MAGIAEVPVVIYNAQRPGPATGLPTRNEQADLLFTIHASQGEFPRFVLTPTTIEECFRAGWQAHNFADKYQTPALVLSDHYLAVATRTVEMDALDFDEVTIERGELLTKEQLDAMEEPYLRFRVTESGVSPRAVPGHPKAVYVTTANEHEEWGAVSEEPEVREAQTEKRMRKLAGMIEEVEGPFWYGPEEAEQTFICWGSTYGPLKEAVEWMNADQPGRANMLYYTALHPFPQGATEKALERTKETIVVESNATGQLETLLSARTCWYVDRSIRRYDGKIFTPEYIIRKAEKS
jgi:2-oxoglutarate ferredoxin oxidoreductase subunit alpha